MKKKEHETNVLTGQLVSQLLYQNSILKSEDFNKITSEILNLLHLYEKKVEKLRST